MDGEEQTLFPEWRFQPAVHEADARNPEISLAPWAGHRQFAYDYVRNIRPGTIVELGTFHGCAFFAFCQAAKDEGLDWTRLYAVDNWRGNAHDTFYDEAVFETFLAVGKACFGTLDLHPVRKQFLDAVPDFKDASIDLLHIDGLHTYEAVAEDYFSWLPKLADEGVVLLHDVFTERHGATRFWREMTGSHPSLLFEHCFGLGLLFPKGDKLFRFLSDQGLPRLAPLYTRIGRLEMELAQARADAHKRVEAETRACARVLEDRLRQAEAETARQREETNTWRQAALDSQWLLDSLKGDGCSTD